MNKKIIKIGIVVAMWIAIITIAAGILIKNYHDNKIKEATDEEIIKIMQATEKLDHDVKAIVENQGEIQATKTENGYEGEGYLITTFEKEDNKTEYVFYLGEKEVFRYIK